jgi:hypothetical protein
LPDRDAERLDRKIDQIADGLPESAGGFLRWLKSPSSRWVRIPIALLLIVGGVVGFLPVLGFWMIPLGLLSGAGCARPPAADIARVDMARAKMGPMETAALRWRKSPWDLDGKLAFILAIPVMNARGVHLDQNETSRLNAIFKPTLEVLCPMGPELVLVTN